MDHGKNLHEDYLRCDKVWQRVASELQPYPEARGAMRPAETGGCCMAQRREEAEALRDFIEHELSDRRVYLAHLRCAPPQERAVLHRSWDRTFLPRSFLFRKKCNTYSFPPNQFLRPRNL